MSEWQKTTLGDLCDESGGDIQTGPFGSQLHAADYVSVGIPSIMPQNIGDNRISTDGIARINDDDAQRLSRYLVKKGDIVYSRRGDVERRALIREEQNGWLCGTGCLRVRFGNKKPIDPTFMSHYLGDPIIRAWIVQHAVGATMPNLNTSILSNVPVLLPSYREQKAIAAILGALDDKIELNRRMNATLEAMARALFKSWFVDFDPVRAKMGGEQPFGMDAETAALFPSRLVPSELGDIPEGWAESTLQTLADINPETWGESDHPDFVEYVDLANTKWGVIESTTHYSWSAAPSRARRILKPGDTIVGTVRPGNGSFSFIGETNLTGSTGFAVLRPKKKIYREAVYFCVTASENIERMAHLADGGAYPAIRPEVALNTFLVFSSDKILEAFAVRAAPLVEKVETNKAENKKLAKLRDYLLPRLISGDIRIPDAEKFVEGF